MIAASTVAAALALASVVALLALLVLRRRAARREFADTLDRAIANTTEAVAINERRSGVYLDVNPAWCRLLGFERAAVIGKTPLDLGIWENPHDYTQLLALLRETSSVQSFDMSARTADGRVLVCRFSVLIVLLDGREVVLTWGHDVTNLVRAEEAVRESEETFRRMIETTPDATALNVWRDGTYLEVNAAWCAFVGKRREELIGTHVPAAFGDDRAMLIDLLKRDGTVRSLDLRYLVDGKLRIGSVSASRFRVRDRELVVTLVRDVTETRRIEHELRDSEERFRTLTDSAPVGIFRADANDRLLYVNPHWQEMNGRHADAVVGSDWTLALERDDRERFLAERARQAATLAPVDGDFRYVHGSGEIRWMRAYVMPLRDPNGAVVGSVGIERDVTQQKSLEQMRRDLVRMLTHDLKNPLAVIVGSVELLRDDLRSRRDPTAMLDAIESSAERAADLALNFLDTDRIDSGALTPRRTDASINEMVLIALERQAARARLAGVVLRDELDPEIPAIAVDGPLIDRVLANLLSNALKFSPRGSTVRVSTRAADAHVVIAVADEGPGIAPEDHARLFQRYARGAASKADSTGLGLFVVRIIVEAHGGSVTARNGSAGGAVFEVFLPRDPT